MEQNKNTAMTITDSAHDDLGGMIPENIHAPVRRSMAIWEHEQNKNIYILHLCKIVRYQ